MAYSVKNSLFVRNLSPQVNEQSLREIFEECDEIEKIFFKPYPNSASQFYAQIDFKTSKGIIEGSKISGTNILGVACQCGVVDPTQMSSMPKPPELVEGEKIEEAMKAEYERRQREAEEDQRFRTVHISNIPPDTQEANIRMLCNNFGEIEALRIVKNDDDAFALVEFKERGPAHVAKNQQQFLVDGRLLTITESKVFVDESANQEKNVHFQNPLLDAMNMRTILYTSEELKGKVKQVREAAKDMFKKPGEAGEDDSSASSSDSSTDSSVRRQREALRLEKQKKKERREEKKAKIERKKRKAAIKEAKRKAREEKKRRQKDADKAAGKESGSEEGVASVASTSNGTVELDDEELEVVPNTELLVLGTSSSSSSSSDEEAKEAKKAEIEKKKQEEAAKKKQEEKKQVEDEAGVFDIEAHLANNVMDIEAEEKRKAERMARRTEVRRKIVTSSAAGLCSVPGCVRPCGHDGPHIDEIGSTLIVKSINKGKKKRKPKDSRSRSQKRRKK